LRLLAVQERFAHKFIPFSPLGFACFAWSLPGQLAPTFAALPPFDKIVTRALVPEVAVAGLLEGDEAPDATRLLTFLMMRIRLTVAMLSTLGVCFSEFTDTKSVSSSATE
jgi:hypothetical protein